MNFPRTDIALILVMLAVPALTGCATGEPARESRFQSIQKSSVGGKFATISGEEYRRTTEGKADPYIPQRK